NPRGPPNTVPPPLVVSPTVIVCRIMTHLRYRLRQIPCGKTSVRRARDRAFRVVRPGSCLTAFSVAIKSN
ncbi:hypothetical protein, partial [Lysobacter capsici]|uniref:hypothetical protein n=1 Tax=Lysobacter capsici TaxID=435897 RepID=UPI00398D5566